MKVAIGVPVMYNFEGYAKLMRSVQGHEFVPYVQDNWHTNIGVAASWNLFLNWAVNDGVDLLFIVNDDVTFADGSLTNAIDAWQDRPEDCILMTAHCSKADKSFYPGMADFCCFAINPREAIDQIGLFDQQNFYPGYFEDDDYLYRIKLSPKQYYMYGGLKVSHDGSKTQFWNGEENRVVSHEAFRANQKRYVDKWGGPPEHELYTEPYNGVRGD